MVVIFTFILSGLLFGSSLGILLVRLGNGIKNRGKHGIRICIARHTSFMAMEVLETSSLRWAFLLVGGLWYIYDLRRGLWLV